MQRETVLKYISEYRGNLSRCEHLRTRVQILNGELQMLERDAVLDGVRITNRYSDMPGGGGGRTSDSVAQLATKLADGIENDRQRDCREELEQVQAELDRIYPAVLFVEAWLHAPKPDERFVIEQKLVQEMSWRQVGYAFQREYGVTKSLNGLKSLLRTGMERIYKLAE